MKPFLSVASLVLGAALDAEATSAPSSAPSVDVSFCGFPLDFLLIPDPFAEPLEICNGLADSRTSCEEGYQFFSGYECFWENGQCTSSADLTGEDQTCPPILNQTVCEDTSWFGPRKCVWWEPTMSPSSSPSEWPSLSPTDSPSYVPSSVPSDEPTGKPSSSLSVTPSGEPSVQPSRTPSRAPSRMPSSVPSSSPTAEPSARPSLSPSAGPSGDPSQRPSQSPSLAPSTRPSQGPSQSPSMILSPSTSPSLSFSPTLYPSSYPTGIPSSEPSQNPTVTLTGAPSASPSARPSQSSRPSDLPSRAPSDQPSFRPSLSPSKSSAPSFVPSSTPTKDKDSDKTIRPTVSQAPSSSPSESFSPSALPTVRTIPPVLLDPDIFSWDIERLGPAEVAFNDASDREEIMIDYNISLRENTVVVYETDCKTEVPNSIIAVQKSLTPNTALHGTLAVDLDIMQSTITRSPVWTNGSVGIGYIDICIRVDLILIEGGEPPTSVNFHETQLALTIDLTQNFQMSIDFNRTAAEAFAQNAAVNYTVITCQCDTEQNCIDEVVLTGDDVYFCLWTTSPDIEFVAIQTVEFTQKTLKWHPVLDGEEDDLTAVTLEGDKCVVRTQMASVFFAEDNPEDVIVNGVALLAFANITDSSTIGGGRDRRLHNGNIFSRRIQEERGEGTANFGTRVGLGSAESSSSSCRSPLSLMALLAASCFFLLI